MSKKLPSAPSLSCSTTASSAPRSSPPVKKSPNRWFGNVLEFARLKRAIQSVGVAKRKWFVAFANATQTRRRVALYRSQYHAEFLESRLVLSAISGAVTVDDDGDHVLDSVELTRGLEGLRVWFDQNGN